MTTYNGERWVQSRRAALARDDRRCQDCGTQDDLHVHHITPVKQFDNSRDAHYLDNLVVLCKYCHPRWEGEDSRPRLADVEAGISVYEIVSGLESDMIGRMWPHYAPKDVYNQVILHSPGYCCTCHSAVDSGEYCGECGRAASTTPSDPTSLETMLERVPALAAALRREDLDPTVDTLYDVVRSLKSSDEYDNRDTDIWRTATALAIRGEK